jgi:hypothetical protein
MPVLFEKQKIEFNGLLECGTRGGHSVKFPPPVCLPLSL